MPKFAANLSMLFTEVPFLERFERAARAGFTAVEFQFPYAFAAADIAERLRSNGLVAVLHNLPPGDWEGGERGIACHPDRVDEFRRGVTTGIEYAKTLGVAQLNCVVGKRPPGSEAPTSGDESASRCAERADERIRSTLVGNLRYAADQLDRAGLRLLVEPINSHDIAGFYLTHVDQALGVLDEVGSSNAFLQFDIYHAQRVRGELAATLEKHLHRIAHIQIADNPGRHEPGTGEINYEFLFAHLDRLGYRGWIGCEYKPATTTEAGLGWLARAMR